MNVAARMETPGASGKSQVSQDVCECLRGEFAAKARGEIDVKGRGRMPAWFLLARNAHAALDTGAEVQPVT